MSPVHSSLSGNRTPVRQPDEIVAAPHKFRALAIGTRVALVARGLVIATSRGGIMDEMQTQARSATPLQTGKTKFVYTIIERGEKKYWVRIGTAWVNNDLSVNVQLDASPTNGKLHIRDADFSGYGARRENREGPDHGGGVA
jgi:hypothetical protein